MSKSKSHPEYKSFRENYDKVIPYFIDRFKFLEDMTYDVFVEMNNRHDEIVNVVTRNMLDFCELIRFFSSCIK
jgi:hypothetical protein